jgi:DNA-binding response OmpR family regulator
LLVEDHPDTLNAMARLLRFSGYQVSTAATLSEAMTLADSGSPDLLVCDLSLPDGDGTDVMRQVCRGRQIPAIAVTGHCDGPELRAAEQAGFALRLTKPVELTVLLAAIANVTGRPPTDESHQPAHV